MTGLLELMSRLSDSFNGPLTNTLEPYGTLVLMSMKQNQETNDN
jgi:hypothetical protein